MISSKLILDKKLQIQEAQLTPSRINSPSKIHFGILFYNYIKLKITKKKKIRKKPEKKNHLTYRGPKRRITSIGLSEITEARKELRKIFTMLRGESTSS